MIEAAAPYLIGGEHEPGILARLGADNDNLRLAAAWTVRERGSRAEMALRFAAALFWYWYGSTMHFGAGQFREGRRFITEAMSRARSEGCNTALRGRALTSLGLIGLAQGDYQRRLRGASRRACDCSDRRRDADSVTFVLSKYGATRSMLGDLDHGAGRCSRRRTLRSRSWRARRCCIHSSIRGAASLPGSAATWRRRA